MLMMVGRHTMAADGVQCAVLAPAAGCRWTRTVAGRTRGSSHLQPSISNKCRDTSTEAAVASMERGRSRKISLADLHVFPEPPARLRLTGFGVTKYGRGEDLQPPAVRHVPILVEAEAGPGLDEAGRPSTEHSGGRAGQKVVPGHQARRGRVAGVRVIMSPAPSL